MHSPFEKDNKLLRVRAQILYHNVVVAYLIVVIQHIHPRCVLPREDSLTQAARLPLVFVESHVEFMREVLDLEVLPGRLHLALSVGVQLIHYLLPERVRGVRDCRREDRAVYHCLGEP